LTQVIRLLLLLMWVIESIAIGMFLVYKHRLNKLLPSNSDLRLAFGSNNGLALSPSAIHHRVILWGVVCIIGAIILLVGHISRWRLGVKK
jgi:lipoprotein signal peptidase